MEIVNVIGAPRTSFNKHRRMSDLVRTQVQHFKHLAHAMGEHAHAEVPHHAVLTEHDAAVFIHAMTGVLRKPKAKAISIQRAKVDREETVFAIAAEAEETKKPRGGKKKGKAKDEKKRAKKELKLKKREAAAKRKKASPKRAKVSTKATKKVAVKKSAADKKSSKRSKR